MQEKWSKDNEKDGRICSRQLFAKISEGFSCLFHLEGSSRKSLYRNLMQVVEVTAQWLLHLQK